MCCAKSGRCPAPVVGLDYGVSQKVRKPGSRSLALRCRSMPLELRRSCGVCCSIARSSSAQEWTSSKKPGPADFALVIRPHAAPGGAVSRLVARYGRRPIGPTLRWSLLSIRRLATWITAISAASTEILERSTASRHCAFGGGAKGSDLPLARLPPERYCSVCGVF